MNNNQNQIDTLNDLLKGEHMAAQIYKKAKGMESDTQVKDMLYKFEQDHQRHAELLTQRIKELGGTPVTSTGLTGVMVNLTTTVNSLRGPKQLLKQLYDGEDKGIHAYEDRMNNLDPITQSLVKGIMQEDHEHLKFFKARIEEEKNERQNN